MPERCERSTADAMRESLFDGSTAVVRAEIFPPKHKYDAFRDFSDYADCTLRSNPDFIAKFGGSVKSALLRYSLFRRMALKNSLSQTDSIPFPFAKLFYTELINEAQRYPPKETLPAMLSVLERCDEILPRAECEMLYDIICDYCIANGRELPSDVMTFGFSDCDFVRDTIMHRFFRAFCERDEENAEKLSLFAVSEVCGFAFKNSPAYLVNPEICERAISKCVCRYTEEIAAREGSAFTPKHATAAKTLYCGLAVKSEQSVAANVEYLSYTSLEDYIYEVGEIAKYADNTLRRAFGIKSIIPGIRLSQYLRTIVQRVITSEYPTLFNPKKRGRKPKPKPETARIPTSAEPIKRSVEVNIERARALEESSWDIAKRLGAEYGEDEMIVIGGIDADTSDDVEKASEGEKAKTDIEYNPENEWECLAASLDRECARVIELLLEGGDVKGFAAERGAIAGAYFAIINNISSDIVGDIIIDSSRSRIIEDYEEELSCVLPLLRKISSSQRL